MKEKILFLLFISISSSILGQLSNEFGAPIVNPSYITTSFRSFSSFAKYKPDGYIGSPYQEDVFQSGTIYQKNKSAMNGLYLRYNVYQNIIEVKNNNNESDKEIQFLIKSPDFFAKIGDNLIIYDAATDFYYTVLFIGNEYTLYKKTDKKLYPAKKALNSFGRDVLATFKNKESFYLVSKDGKLHEIPSKKKKRIKFFGNKQTEIGEYVKKYKLDITDPAILIKIVRYFDSFKDASLK